MMLKPNPRVRALSVATATAKNAIRAVGAMMPAIM
ncbi:MAG: hypothetical protein ACI8S3_001476 [Alphaproteobacteria bacterium]|jgi:hypothetical protein